MADPAILAEKAKSNGGDHAERDGRGEALRAAPLELVWRAGDAAGRIGAGALGAGTSAAGTLLGAAAKRIRGALTADLDDRDPDYIRENLPLAWLAATIWYRAEVRNMGKVPEEGPVL